MMDILVLAGGLGAEREVSFMSAASVEAVLRKMCHEVIRLDPKPDLAAELILTKPDLVFNCLHGTYGEDGAIPGLLEVMKIPYTHSGVMASAIAMNKIMTKRIAGSAGIRMPKDLKMKSHTLFEMLSKNQHPMAFPYVIKPVAQGSTIGIFIIHNNNSYIPKSSDWHYSDDVLIEEYIPGQEVSVAVFNDAALGCMELTAKSGFYDYTAKYTDGMTEHIYPAPIPASIYKEALKVSETMHKILGCRTLSRSDFRYNSKCCDSGLYFLELNTHPGFTNLSIVHEIAEHNGISFEDMVRQLLKDAKCEIAA